MRMTLPPKLTLKPVHKVLLGLSAALLVGPLVLLVFPTGRPLLIAIISQPMRLQDFLWGAAFAVAAVTGWVLWSHLSSELR